MIVLIVIALLFSSVTLHAAKRGLLLWFTTMLPTLLPYMIGINYILYLTDNNSVCAKYLILLGPFCGYPVGAKLCASLYKSRQLTKNEAVQVLPLINLPSPAYLLSYVFSQTLGAERHALMKYLLCIYAPVLICSLIVFLRSRNKSAAVFDIAAVPAKAQTPAFFDACILDAFTAITKLGGYIILFSILSEFFLALFSAHLNAVSILLISCLEITNGTELIIGSGLSFSMKRLFILLITSFGGISCIFQTKSLLADTDLPIAHYLFVKIFMAIFTGIFVLLFI